MKEWNKTEKDIIDGGKTIPYKTIKQYPEAEKEFIKQNKKGHQFPTIQKYACGEYATRSILSMHGKGYVDVDIANQDGVDIKGIQKRLRKSGIETEIIDKAKFEDIEPKSIVYYPKEDHWVTVESVSGDKIKIHDSNYTETKTYNKKTFEDKWLDKDSGYLVLTKDGNQELLNTIYSKVKV